MVTLDQIRSLEAKVQRTVAYIADLKEENALLQQNLEKYRLRIEELEVLINGYKEDQNEIEQGIMNALSHLDRLEDDISKSPPQTPAEDSAQTIGEIDDIEGRPVVPADEDSADPDDSGNPAEREGELDIF
jgi:chromosome segregation ATPase